MRPTIDSIMITTAILFSKRGTCARKQVGCVVARNKRVISTGYVGSLPGEPHCIDEGCLPGPDGGCERTIHAEANAIMDASKRGQSLVGTELYTTLSPCRSCAELILLAGIEKVFYLDEYRNIEPLNFLIDKGVYVEQISKVEFNI